MDPLDELQLWRSIGLQLHQARCITLNNGKIIKLLDLIDAWASAHNCSNGELSDEECDKRIVDTLQKCQHLLTQELYDR